MMRSGFSMITAIFVMVLIATVMMVMMTTTSAEKTANIYLKEQTHLVARSATEYALLAASAHDFENDGCLETVEMDVGVYDAEVRFYYIGNGLGCAAAHTIDDSIATADSNGTVIMDTVVSYPLGNGQEARYARRTLQKL